VAVVVAALLCLGIAGCSGKAAAALTVRVDSGPVAFDDASPVTISGADPSHPVTVVASARDDGGTTWTSRAGFTPGPDGTVNPATAAPRSGSYTGAHATGLIWSMSAGSRHPVFRTGTEGPMTVTYTASQPGRTSVSATQQRWFRAPGVTVTETRIDSPPGFVARMFTPSHPAPHAGAVLVFGGSEGGLLASVVPAEALASHGHPALALAYFGAPGLPRTLANIPLEYFARALAWLNKQPGVDPMRTAVAGGSRGSEAALLLGALYPSLVHGVIATSPTSFVHGGWPDTTKPAWTWHGRPVVRSPGAQQRTPVDESATIPVARIRGPVLLLCGTDDDLWPSCTASDTVRRELAGRPVTELREPGAGHLVDFFVPNLPLASTTLQQPGSDQLTGIGGTVQADALGRLDAWPAVLKFLDAIPG
jgi:dienelactone hydrolase